MAATDDGNPTLTGQHMVNNNMRSAGRKGGRSIRGGGAQEEEEQ